MQSDLCFYRQINCELAMSSSPSSPRKHWKKGGGTGNLHSYAASNYMNNYSFSDLANHASGYI